MIVYIVYVHVYFLSLQDQRDNIIQRFRTGEIWVLICTDLVARGIDFKVREKTVIFCAERQPSCSKDSKILYHILAVFVFEAFPLCHCVFPLFFAVVVVC